MARKLFYFVLVLVLAASTAQAVVTQWTGAVSRNWMDPLNWNSGVPGVGIGIDNTQINKFTPGATFMPLISAGQVASTANGDTWGPEWGITWDIEGGSYSGPAFIGINGVGDDINPSTLNLGQGGTGGSINIVNMLAGDAWWWDGGHNLTFNEWSGTCIVNDYLWLGGKMDLYGGYTKATNGFVMHFHAQPSSTNYADIYAPSVDGDGGKLSLPGTLYSDGTIAALVAGGYIKSPNGTLVYDLASEPGRVVISAIPEPATIVMLLMGAVMLFVLRRR